MTVTSDPSAWPPHDQEGQDTSTRPKDREDENYQHDPSGKNEDNPDAPSPEDQQPEAQKKAQAEMREAEDESAQQDEGNEQE